MLTIDNFINLTLWEFFAFETGFELTPIQRMSCCFLRIPPIEICPWTIVNKEGHIAINVLYRMLYFLLSPLMITSKDKEGGSIHVLTFWAFFFTAEC